MKRWRVEIAVCCEDDEVTAATEDEAIREATRRAESGGLEVSVVDAHAYELGYERPPGTDRWGAAAEAIRFADTCHRWFAAEDGFWWWTNGHAALKCIAPAPPDAEASRMVDRSLAAAVGDYERREVTWGPESPFGDLTVRRAVDDRRVVANVDYLHLVEAGFCGRPVRWMVAAIENDRPFGVPMLAYDGDEIVAVVMPVRDATVGRP